MNKLEALFFAALVFYSLAIWSHKITRKLSLRIMSVFGVGLAVDILGTILLCATNANGWKFSVHTISGILALLIMTLHFIWALSAIKIGGNFESYFNRFSLSAWTLWLLAFFSGVIL